MRLSLSLHPPHEMSPCCIYPALGLAVCVCLCHLLCTLCIWLFIRSKVATAKRKGRHTLSAREKVRFRSRLLEFLRPSARRVERQMLRSTIGLCIHMPVHSYALWFTVVLVVTAGEAIASVCLLTRVHTK